MDSTDLFYEKGKLELCTLIDEPTNKFMKLERFVYGIVSFHDGKIRVPARITDQLLCEGNIDLSSLEGREVTPRFRRRYSVGKSEVVPTISLAFTLADEYYPHQEYKVIQPSKDYELPRHRRLWRLHFTIPHKRRRHRTRGALMWMKTR